MNNLWSDKKYINIIINISLFLASMNFMHYGQLFIAFICVVLFVDNKFKIKVNNIKTFIILLLFAITFFVFSYKQGIYSLFGFFLPMAYYIGSNVKQIDDNSMIKIIYLIAFGMSFYIALNLIYTVFLYGSEILYHSWEYDIWLKQRISPTTISTFMLFIISMSYYLLHYEKDKKLKVVGLIAFIFVMLFNLKLGRRSPYVITIASLIVSFVIDVFIIRNRNIDKKRLIKFLLFVIILVLLIILLYIFDYKNFRFYFDTMTIINKIKNYGLNPERLDIFIESLKYMPKYLFGGQKISSILGIQIHDLWFDIYDYAGILPFIFICIYTIKMVLMVIRLINNKVISNTTKIVIITFSLCIFLEMLIEPIMTGSSLLLICSIIVFASFEKLLY